MLPSVCYDCTISSLARQLFFVQYFAIASKKLWVLDSSTALLVLSWFTCGFIGIANYDEGAGCNE